MLRPSPARDASTCLRCNLRLVLRQIHHRRFQSSDDSPPSAHSQDRTTGFRILRPHGNHGRIRGKKGGQRRVESAEPLTIKSLGQSSEVIVLRDLHEPKKQKKPVQEAAQSDDAENPIRKVPSLTARDIENLSGRRAPRPPPSEVFESIESLKPDEGIFVLSKSEFDAKLTALAKSYNIAQLRGYLYQKTTSLPRTKTPSRSLPPQEPVQATEISTTHGELQDLKRTSWHPGTTGLTKRLPMLRAGVERQFQMGRKMNNKEYIVESILRDAWAVMVEEEEANIGEMEFWLTPMQFGLLLTKNSNTLRPLLETSQFYKNSRFQLYQSENVIRIIGPRGEVEAIASVLSDAFAPARSAEIGLDTFPSLLQQDSSSLDLADIFGPKQLGEIMDLTKTYIRYESDSKCLRIASFVDVAINDAHRLLMALLPLPLRNRTHVFYDNLHGDQCRLETALTTRNLPFRTKYQDLGRWVTSAPKIIKSESRIANLFLSELENPDAAEDSNNSKNSAAGVPDVPLSHDRPIVKQALEALNATPTLQAGSRIRNSYWQSQPRTSWWKAQIGHLLHEPQEDTAYPSTPTLSVNTSRMNDVLAPQVPNLVGLLNNSKPLGAPKRMSWEGATQLIAHLIPSPLEDTGVLATTAFPQVQLRFTIENTMLRKPEAEPAKSNQRPRIRTNLDNGKQVTFRDLRAIVDHEVVELNLPSFPVDLRFERKHSLMSRFAESEPHIRSFVEAVHESMRNDAALRAPPALQLRIPKWAISLKSLESHPADLQSAAKVLHGKHYHARDEVTVKYLFAGFEHREKNDVEVKAVTQGYRARIETIEAGVTGGRRVELSLLPKPDITLEMAKSEKKSLVKGDAKGLLGASIDLVNFLRKIQRGEIEDMQENEGKTRRPREDARLLYQTHGPSTISTASGVSSVVAEGSSAEENVSVEEAQKQEAEASDATTIDFADKTSEEPSVEQGEQVVDEAAQPGQRMIPSAEPEERMPEDEILDEGQHQAIDKVAQQEQGLKLETNEDPRVPERASEEVPLKEMEPREVKKVVERAVEQAVQSSEGTIEEVPEQKVEEQLKQETAEQPEQKLEELAEQKQQEQAEEPLSVRLRRLMGAR